MEDIRAQQIEALEVFKDYNSRLVKSMNSIIPELEGDRKDDTDKFLDEIVKGINWEIGILNGYLEERLRMEPEPGHENALFISQKNTRITVRSVERLVKKYASTASVKKITPHKLRSTYGTALYQETGDIYLVADVLGHKNVNTTRKHYAAMAEENKRKAAKVVQLREK